MFSIEPQFSLVSVVLVGNLNPKIFTPDWFARHELLTGKEADAAEVEVIHPQITKFRAGWLSLLVETERFVCDTTEPPIQLRDLVVRTFSEHLSHTPLRALGINRTVDFSVGNVEQRDRIGYKLAPPEAWGSWAKDLMAASDKKRSGMTSLTMRQTIFKEARPPGHTSATVQPSTRIKKNAGIFVQVNDHYEVENPGKVTGADEVIRYLAELFDQSLSRSEWIVNNVMELKDV